MKMNVEREKIINNLLRKDDSEDKGLRALMISTDRNIFKADSVVRERMVNYGKSLRQLHIIIFTKKFHGFKPQKIAENVWIYPTNSWTRWFYVFDAVRLIKSQFGKFLPKVISVISSQDPFETGIVGWMVARKFKLPLQIQIHTDFLNSYFWQESFLNKARVLMGKFLVKRADCIRVVSERIKSSLKAKSYKLKDDPVVLPIFVDVDRLKNAPITFDIRERYSQFSFILLMVARLEKEKNITLAIEIMKELMIENSRIGMVIVGEGRERKNLEKLIAKYNLGRNVIFEGWQNDMVSYYKTANVFLSTSLYEGYGMAMVEALASGCPVVSSDSGIAGEIIFEGDNGFVCSVSDKSCFVRKIAEIMKMPGLRERLRINSKSFIVEKMSKSEEDYLIDYRKNLEGCLKRYRQLYFKN